MKHHCEVFTSFSIEKSIWVSRLSSPLSNPLSSIEQNPPLGLSKALYFTQAVVLQLPNPHFVNTHTKSYCEIRPTRIRSALQKPAHRHPGPFLLFCPTHFSDRKLRLTVCKHQKLDDSIVREKASFRLRAIKHSYHLSPPSNRIFTRP